MGDKLFVFDVGGTIRDDSYACYMGYKLGFDKAGVAYPFDIENVWRLRGIGKYNRSSNCVRAIIAFMKAGEKPLSALEKDDPEKYIDDLVAARLSPDDETKANEIISNRKDFMDTDEAIASMKLYPRVNEALAGMKKSGHALAILSNIGSAEGIKKSIRGLDASVFSLILSASEVTKKKPSGEGILKVSQTLGFSSDKVYYVGDTQVDVLASREAGCKAVSVLTGMGTRRILEMSRPDFIFDDIYAISKFFQSR
ncbi:MAG: HAD family hydrolase [Candidatus Micrarchaeota archaeon]|nr:HAD family hydrolase [Candidatus Micrarchaeota archaeon]